MIFILSFSFDTTAKLFKKPLWEKSKPWENQHGKGKIITLSWGKFGISITFHEPQPKL